MKKFKLNNIMDKILILFLLIQPLFDIKFFYNSVSTLIRVIIILALFLYYFFNSKNKHKYWLFLYPLLIGIYFVFHHFNALSFNSLVPGNFDYSIFKEGLYFVKMICPFLLIYSLYKSNISKEKLIDLMQYLVLIISVIIIVSNLFCFSYGSYSDAPIKANIFQWFNSTYTYQDLASKGLFEYANQISAILIMFLPFSIYAILRKAKLFNWLILVFNVFSLILLCTKVSVLGILVVFAFTLFAYIFILLINKNSIKFKQYIPIGAVFLIYALLLPVNPMFSRMNERATIETFSENTNSVINNETYENISVTPDNTVSTNPTIPSSPSPTNTSNNMFEYIEANYKAKQLHEQFLFKCYPYIYDSEFWYNLLHEDLSLTTNYRFIEISMVQRVIEINNNHFDKWLGITNTRLQNIFNIERDFVVQYYALGFIGVILVFAPYFAILLGFALNTIYLKFKNLDIISLLAGISIVFAFGISYFSGNLLNSLSFTIYFAILFALLLENKNDTV